VSPDPVDGRGLRGWRAAVGASPEPRGLLFAAATAALVGALASAQGGYFPTSWGWGALLFLMPMAVAWAAGASAPPTIGGIALVAAAAVITAWVTLSLLWTTSFDATVEEVERSLLLLAAAAGAVTFVSARRARFAVGGVLTAIAVVCVYSLATRLFPNRLGVFDPLGVYRLSDPIGYWNGLAVFAAMGMMLALVHVARARRLPSRCAAAAAVPVLAQTFYFTFGRAAWIALAVGLLVAFAIDVRRTQLAATLLTLLPTAATAILVAAHARALTHKAAPIGSAVHDGHHVAKIVVALALAAVLIECGRSLVARRVPFGTGIRMTFGALCVVAVLAGAVAAVEAAGGPRHVAHRAREAFVKRPRANGDLNSRLLSFSANGRVELWRVAWADAKAHPWLGSGAGSYERYWLQHRPNELNVRDAHSLYLESLAELGPIGLAAIVALIAVALGVCIRARRSPLIPGAAGAIAVYAAHAGTDWDWELAALGVIVIVLAAAAAASPDRLGAPMVANGRVRGLVTVVAVALALVAGATLAGNVAVARSERQLDDRAWADAAGSAELAHRWLPWTATPWLLLGRAQQGAGDHAAARRSYEHGLRLDPHNWLLWLDAAEVSPRRTRTQRLQAAARLNPHAPEVHSAP
jgi:hypothetical protein